MTEEIDDGHQDGCCHDAETRDVERLPQGFRYRTTVLFYLFCNDFQTALSSHIAVFFHDSKFF